MIVEIGLEKQCDHTFNIEIRFASWLQQKNVVKNTEFWVLILVKECWKYLFYNFV